VIIELWCNINGYICLRIHNHDSHERNRKVNRLSDHLGLANHDAFIARVDIGAHQDPLTAFAIRYYYEFRCLGSAFDRYTQLSSPANLTKDISTSSILGEAGNHYLDNLAVLEEAPLPRGTFAHILYTIIFDNFIAYGAQR